MDVNEKLVLWGRIVRIDEKIKRLKPGQDVGVVVKEWEKLRGDIERVCEREARRARDARRRGEDEERTDVEEKRALWGRIVKMDEMLKAREDVGVVVKEWEKLRGDIERVCEREAWGQG